MRLIDADKLYESLIESIGWLMDQDYETYSAVGDAIRFVTDQQPTAYDINKVVEWLEKLKKQNPFINGIRDNSIEAAASRQTLDYAIEIVKKGESN
nr:MAG TPA: Protein of unknown function (DUF3349) [Caudoviricetes sp.]